MLDVTYEAAAPAGGQAAHIDEERGLLRVYVDPDAPLPVVLLELNGEFARVLRACTWFQVWDGEVLSYRSPVRLSITFVLDRLEPRGVVLREQKGRVTVHVDPVLSSAEFVAVMNPTVLKLLTAGAWFQIHDGEVIDMCPASLARVS